MKILHTSDWHLGRQFHGISLIEDQKFVLEQIIEVALKEKVDVVLISGDIYDRSIPPIQAISLLNETLFKLSMQNNIPVILIAGNHDSHERISFGSKQMMESNLHIIGPLTHTLRPIILNDDYGPVYFYGIPYVEPVVVRDIFKRDKKVEKIKTHDQALEYLTRKIDTNDKRTVVLSHCFIDGSDECDSERVLSIGGADRVSYKHFEKFSYTALGHLHSWQFRGQKTIQYSGSILKYSFSEQKHIKGVNLVTLDETGSALIERIPLKPRRNLRSIEGEFKDILNRGKSDENTDDYLLIKLTDPHTILDPMVKLREVYPNILHLERVGLIFENKATKENKIKNKSEFNIFNDFFKQVTDLELTTDQQEYLLKIIDKARLEEHL
jgi:exonuclease SbcD